MPLVPLVSPDTSGNVATQHEVDCRSASALPMHDPLSGCPAGGPRYRWHDRSDIFRIVAAQWQAEAHLGMTEMLSRPGRIAKRPGSCSTKLVLMTCLVRPKAGISDTRYFLPVSTCQSSSHKHNRQAYLYLGGLTLCRRQAAISYMVANSTRTTSCPPKSPQSVASYATYWASGSCEKCRKLS